MFKLTQLILCCISLLPINFLFYFKALAQSVGAKNQLLSQNNISSCQDAITQSKTKLKKAKTDAIIEKAKHSYKDYPSNRHSSYLFALKGPGSENVLNSSVFLKNISTNIISSCKDIGMVSFGIYKTDHGASFGLMNDGNIQQFQCKESSGSNLEDLQWGYEYCL